jgi:hypothetical protein
MTFSFILFISIYQPAAYFIISLMSNTVHNVPPTPADKGQDSELQAKPTWTSEALLALAEETSNHGAHIPEYGAVEKRWKEVLEAMQNRGFNFSNFRTLQRRFDRLMEEFKKGSRAKATTSGVEDDEENPLDILLEDMADEIQDHQAEKEKKKNDEKNREAALVAGGKELRDKAATQIISGQAIKVGGDEIGLCNLRSASPALSMFGGSDNGENGTSFRGKRSREEKLLSELLESERKKIESDNETRLEEQRLREKQAEKTHETRMEIHRAEMAMRKQELEVKLQEVEAVRQQNQIMLTTLQNQMLQHQQTMELQMKQFELKMKKREE